MKAVKRILSIILVFIIGISLVGVTARADDYITISIQVAWDDQFDLDGIRPEYSVWVCFQQTGEDPHRVKVWEDPLDNGYSNPWEYKETLWNGGPFTVWVEPDDVPEGYTVKSIEGDSVNGFTVTFKHVHVHNFNKKIPYGQYYLAKDRTCTTGYIWYYACDKCDEASNDMNKTYEDGEPLGHNYGRTDYTWATDLSKCTAERSCTRSDCKQKETETASSTSGVTQNKGCTLDEITTYTATFTNKAFAKQTETKETAPALGHNWDEPSYNWNTANSECTATRVCLNDSNHIETETVESVSQITQNKGCLLAELTTYTASFQNSAFQKQTKENVETAPASGHNWDEPSYNWNTTNSECTATRVCLNDSNHIETETVASVFQITQNKGCLLAELTTYTASFQNSAFQKQTKENVETAPASGHNWDEPSYVWNTDNSECTATRVCLNDSNHIETETVASVSQITQDKDCLQNLLPIRRSFKTRLL